MTGTIPNQIDTPSTYPGVYNPEPFPLKRLIAELQNPHEGETSPLVNIAECFDEYIIEVAAPGLKRRDFLASIHKNVLSIAVFHKEAATVNRRYHRHEFNYCYFIRDIDLPGNVDADFLTAIYKDGILYIRLPKSIKRIMNDVERIIIY